MLLLPCLWSVCTAVVWVLEVVARCSVAKFGARVAESAYFTAGSRTRESSLALPVRVSFSTRTAEMAGPLSAAMSDEGTGSFDNIKYRLANIDPQDGLVVAPLHSHHDEDSATTAIIALHVYKAQDFTNRLSTLTDELERAEQCREKWYDTSFTNGTPQRFLRVKFVESLKRDIRAEVALVGKHIEEHENELALQAALTRATSLVPIHRAAQRSQLESDSSTFGSSLLDSSFDHTDEHLMDAILSDTGSS